MKNRYNPYNRPYNVKFETSFFIVKGNIEESYENFIEASGFMDPKQNGTCKLFDTHDLGKIKLLSVNAMDFYLSVITKCLYRLLKEI